MKSPEPKATSSHLPQPQKVSRPFFFKQEGEGAFFTSNSVQLKSKKVTSGAPKSDGASPNIQLSPLSDQARASYANQEKGRVFDVLRANSPTQDADLRAYIQSIFVGQPDDLWLANIILDHGPEPLWPGALLSERHQRSVQGGWAPEPGNISGTLGTTAQGRSVNALFFPGVTDMHAMVIGGVHGSELSGVEVIDRLLTILQTGPRPHYSVIIVPRLFPDNIATRETGVAAGTIAHDSNTGRYTCDSKGKNCEADPNRQFPDFGHAYDPATQQDSRGRPIESENRMLLELIDRFRPARIVSVHAIHTPSLAGIFADPRTDSSGLALGYDSDRALALAMAERAAAGGAGVQGNRLDASGHTQSSSSTQYRRDPPIAGIGQQQTRSTGSGDLPNNRGRGVSLGGWGSTAICDPANAAHNREAMRIITVEVSTTRRSGDMAAAQQASRRTEIEAHADAIREIFLALSTPILDELEV